MSGPARLADGAGRILLDEAALLRAVEATVAPALAEPAAATLGLRSARVRELATAAVLAAVPHGLDAFEAVPCADERELEEDGWGPVIVSTADELFVVGLDPADAVAEGLSWVKRLRARRIGVVGHPVDDDE